MQGHERLTPTERHLRKSEALHIVEPFVLPAGKTVHTLLRIPHNGVPFDNNSTSETAGIHIRSRFAHVGIDVEFQMEDFLKMLSIVKTFPDRPIYKGFQLTNRGDSPVLLQGGILHFFDVPKGAEVVGPEFADIFPQQDDIVLAYSDTPQGRIATHAYVKASRERSIIRKQAAPFDVAHFATFEEVRKHLKPYFEDITPGTIPENQLYIAPMPEIHLPADKYLVIGTKAYIRNENGDFIETGIQVRSPLVEGRSNEHGHNLELMNAEWVLVRVVRNGSEPHKPG